MDSITITSVSNPTLKAALALYDRRERDATKQLLIEGYRELLRAQQAQIALKQLFFCPELFLGSNEPALLSEFQKRGTILIRCSEKVFCKLSYRDRPDGLVGIAPHFTPTQDAFIAKILRRAGEKANPWIVIAEGVEKPGNLGTILRSCDGAGVSGLIVADPKTDIYNPNVVRASVGTLFTVPFLQTTSQEAYAITQRLQMKIMAATPTGTTIYSDANLSQRLALVLGTEQTGLSEFWMSHADIQVVIPMQGFADSLNVAMAGTILAFEISRQRSKTA